MDHKMTHCCHFLTDDAQDNPALGSFSAPPSPPRVPRKWIKCVFDFAFAPGRGKVYNGRG